MRDIDRKMQNEICEQTRWGDAETYGHTRKPTEGAGYHDKGRNGARGTFPDMDNRNSRRVNNGDERREEMGDWNDFDGNWEYSLFPMDVIL